ncbi:MAG: indole-3-glycerol phosphate synthase TrpC [Anaerolineales bacterium]
MSILAEIFAHKRAELRVVKQSAPRARLEARALDTPLPPDFVAALRDPLRPRPRLIAEVKRRSPSKGLLCRDFDPIRLARTFVENGAAAVSVLTDAHYFGGGLQQLRAVAHCGIESPLLRKDFVFDEYQILEARAAGASAVLLIAAMLTPVQLRDLVQSAQALALAALVEVHTQPELDRALEADATLIGVNNRDLHTFQTTLEVTAALRPQVPANVTLVSESGIRTAADVRRLADLQVDAMLIGEAIVTAPDVGAAVRQLARLEPFNA